MVSSLRDKLATNEDAVTLKSIEVAFTTKESVHRIDTHNKGTPIHEPIALKPSPTIPAASATSKRAVNETSHPKHEGRSKSWPEDHAAKNYGKPGSHKKGAYTYPAHRNRDDHC